MCSLHTLRGPCECNQHQSRVQSRAAESENSQNDHCAKFGFLVALCIASMFSLVASQLAGLCVRSQDSS